MANAYGQFLARIRTHSGIRNIKVIARHLQAGIFETNIYGIGRSFMIERPNRRPDCRGAGSTAAHGGVQARQPPPA